jgi:alpha-tubulin suppressor-like RCC1 family protein
LAVDKSGRLWTWGAGFSGQLGLGDTSNRLAPTLVGAEEVFGGPKVRTVACGHDHTLVVREAGAWQRIPRPARPQRLRRQPGAQERGPAALWE